MAGDYIAMDHELPDKAEVSAIFESTGVPIDSICGRLFLLWRWFDRHTTDGFLPGTGFHALAAKCGGDKPFWESVVSVGWLEVSAQGARLPNFSARFGKTARSRIKTAQRVAKHRSGREDNCNADVTMQALHERYTSVTPPLRERSPEPEPEPEPVSVKTGSGSGVFFGLSEEVLRDDERLMNWARCAASASRPVISSDYRDLLFVFSAAERALEVGKQPARLFGSIIGKGRRNVISESQEQSARTRLQRAMLGAVSNLIPEPKSPL